MLAEILKIAVPALVDLIEAAIKGDLTARERLIDIMGPESRATVQRMIEEVAIQSKFRHG